ncbi:SET domain-containing protein [Candidatus Uhrbacteria bacterium]|nr:SET domain-containing protein [Candidatus Uhrbacteria bacterium]
MSELFEVRDCKLGKGLFARKSIEAGETVLPFEGLVITTSQALEKGEKQSDPLQIGLNRYVDLQDPGRCANHSCDPNAGVNRDLQLVALRNIQPGEEICYDYSTTMGDGLWEISCHCGSTNCRNRIRDFRFLSREIQTHYLSLGVVQPYLAVEDLYKSSVPSLSHVRHR